MARKFGDFKKLTCWKSFINNFSTKSKIETFHTKLYDLRRSGELPLQTSVDKQLIAYWLRVLNKDVHTFAYMVYMMALKLFSRDEYKSQWLKRVKYILDSCGLSYMWYQQKELSTKQCKVIIHQRIEDIALQYYLDFHIFRLHCLTCTGYQLGTESRLKFVF